jgi:hypothetical protein
MKALGIALAAVAVVLVVKGLGSTTTSAPVYYPPPQAKPQPWYSQVAGWFGTVAGTALGSYAALVPKNTSAGTTQKGANGQPVVVYQTNPSGNWSGGPIGSVYSL